MVPGACQLLVASHFALVIPLEELSFGGTFLW